MRLAWGKKVSPEFRARVLGICTGFGWSSEHASWLMACMAFETGRTFSPYVRNAAGSGAVGLIQFMPRTAAGLGTSTDELAAMTAVQQLDYVAKYFQPYARRIHSLNDMYMAILWPAAVGKPDSTVLFSSGKAYAQNAGLDANKDGAVTKAEAAAKVLVTLERGLGVDYVHEEVAVDAPVTTIEEKPVSPLIIPIALELWKQLPAFSKIFKKEDVSERNLEAVQVAVDTVISAVGAQNGEQAIQMVKDDPAIQVVANNAVKVETADLIDALERINKIDQGNIRDARYFNSEEPFMVDTRRLKMKFWHILALLVVFASLLSMGYVLHTSSDVSERTMVLQVLLMGGFVAIIGFVFGGSVGSDKKTDYMMSRQQR